MPLDHRRVAKSAACDMSLNSSEAQKRIPTPGIEPGSSG
jgi:hypothetical protein